MGPPTDSVVYQHQGTARCSAGAFPVPVSSPRSHSGCLLRQHHSVDLPSQGGWHQVSSPQHLGSGDLALDGVPLHPPGSTVPSGLRQRPSRRPVSPSPAPTCRVVSKHDRLSIFEEPLVGSNSFICHLSQSSLFDLLLPFPGSEVSRHGRVSPVLGRPSGLRVPSSGCHSACSREAPRLQGTELTLVTPHWALRPWFSALVQLSLAPPVFLPSRPDLLRLPRSHHIYPDLHRLRLHAWRHSSDLPEPLASPPLSRSSLCWRAVYQVRWSIYRGWCHSNGHSVSRPTWAKVADFLYWLRYTRGLSVSSLRGYRSVLSAVFRFHLPSLSSDPVIWVLLRSFRLSSAERVLRPHAWDLSKVLTYLVSPAFEPLSQASFRALTLTTLFLLALATAKKSWGATGSLFHSHLCGWGCLPFLHPAVCRQVRVAHPFHPSLLFGEVLSRLCGWS